MNPTSSKRRMRREPISNSEIPDSSPSQPAKRRRKLEIPVKTEPEPVPEPENAAPLPIDQAGIGKTDDDLVTAVTNYLEVPPHPVKAIDDNSNCTHEAYGAEVQAYAKLSGNGWTFYIKMLVNVIGRPSEVGDRRDEPPKGIEVGALPKAPQDDRGVHLNLGPNKMVSRNHAEISYDSQSEKWKIHVNGRNGIKHNGNRLNRSQEKLLSSGDVIEVGGCEMMFIMPRDNEPLVIHKMYLRRAHLIRTDDSEITEDEDIEPPSATLGSSAIRGEKGTAKGTPIAPAPPDYKRPGTPDSSRPRINYTMGKSPYAGGTIVMNAEDVDLSKDDNRHIKPTFSYAQLITQAVLSGPNKRQTLANIYKYITDSFAYYRHQTPSGWQNSIRHNLSLHKAFDKTARSPDDPGKGMLWYIKGEHYDEMVNSAFSRGRGGHRGSPGSPSIRTPGENSSVAKPRSKRSNSAASQTVSQYPSDAPQYTPDRAAGSLQDDVPGDGSPLPRHRRHGGTTYGLSNTPGSPPVLPSSYAPEEGSSFVTPAPHRVIPHLAPPSTAQRPSQHMPTSSPAPFWKYAEFHATPSRSLATFDLSPEKGLAGPSLPLSSSPAPIRRSSAVSPSRTGTSAPKYDIPEDLEEEDKGFDLTKGFQSIGSYHAPAPRPSMSLELKPFPAHS